MAPSALLPATRGALLASGVAANTPVLLVTAIAGAAQQAQPQRPSDFVAVRELAPAILPAAKPGVISLPPGTFVHTTQQDELVYEARQADGTPLPPWMRCDARTGELTLNPPADAQSVLDVVVTARDRDGRTASTSLRVALRR